MASFVAVTPSFLPLGPPGWLELPHREIIMESESSIIEKYYYSPSVGLYVIAGWVGQPLIHGLFAASHGPPAVCLSALALPSLCVSA